MARSFKTLIRTQPIGYLAAGLGVSLVIAALLPFHHHFRGTPGLLLVAVVVLVATVWGRRPAIFASAIALLGLNYFFIPPYKSLRINDPWHWFTFISFAASAMIVGEVSTRLKQRAKEVEQARSEIERLYKELESSFERVSQAEAVRRSEPYLKLAQAIAKAGFFDLHVLSKECFWSESHNSVLGLDRSLNPSYENWLRAVHPEDRERMHQAVQHFLASDKNEDQADFRTITSDGSTRWINTRWGLLRDPSGAPIRMLGAIIDVTERKRNEEAARRNERFKSVLLDCVTHDLRTPLTSIRVAATSLLRVQKRRTDAGENERELLGVIDEEADRLNEYIDNLLAMARIEAGELGLQRSAAPVEAIVEEGLQRLRPLGMRSRVNLRVAEALPLIDVDSRALAHVIHILVDNACNYVSDGPVNVSADRTSDGEICLSVEDQGPGIPSELRERVFERFFRIQEAVLSGEREPVLSRTSMGLAIAREIVQAHGGKIWIEDAESGHGTKVLFTIPIASRRISSPADAECIEQWRRFLAESAGRYPPATQNSHSG